MHGADPSSMCPTSLFSLLVLLYISFFPLNSHSFYQEGFASKELLVTEEQQSGEAAVSTPFRHLLPPLPSGGGGEAGREQVSVLAPCPLPSLTLVESGKTEETTALE